MTPNGQPEKRHLRTDRFFEQKSYSSPRSVPTGPDIPPKPRGEHGAALVQSVKKLEQDYAVLMQSWEGREEIRARGIIVEFESPPGVELNLESLMNPNVGLELLNRREQALPDGNIVMRETWFVPDGTLAELERIFSEYLSQVWRPTGEPLRRKLVDSIERLRQGALAQMWTEREQIPMTHEAWFEVWLRAGKNGEERSSILYQFRACAARVGLRTGTNVIVLPEHTILAVYGTGNQFALDLALLNCIAEIRAGRDYADFFENLRVDEQMDFAKSLAAEICRPAQDSLAVCVLDTGVNRGHPLLDAMLHPADNLSINTGWAAADDYNHGTPMAGIALFDESLPTLLGTKTEKLSFPYVLEGVKIVAPPAQRPNDERIAGAYTAQGVAKAELNAPKRARVWCMATSLEGPNDGRPSSWSAELDALAIGRDNDGSQRRLFCLSSGNVPQSVWPDYPQSNHELPVHNPGQSWNALCVGAYTKFSEIRPENGGYSPVAPRGRMAPSNTTSLAWDNDWPNKPDIVLEGGNAGKQLANNSTLTLGELSLLSTHADFPNGPFCTMTGTSPAAGIASRMAARLMAAYPDLWPETVRGLMVHSARWTQQMIQACDPGLTEKRKVASLLRTCGYGVPDLSEAIECASHRATMISQCEIQPYRMEKANVVFNEMHLHRLPWPPAILEKHYNERIRMRVTLSYFVEPNPGNRGYTSVFRYPGCALRFKVCSAGQSVQDFEAQWNKIAADELKAANPESEITKTSTDGWQFGTVAFRGSIHSDVWIGSCADLLSMGYILVHPITGWWRTRPSQGRVAARTKYALLVTLEAENPALDIYTELSAIIGVPIPVAVSV